MSDDNPHSSRGSAPRSWLERIASIFSAEPQDISDLEDIISEAAIRGLAQYPFRHKEADLTLQPIDRDQGIARDVWTLNGSA